MLPIWLWISRHITDFFQPPCLLIIIHLFTQEHLLNVYPGPRKVLETRIQVRINHSLLNFPFTILTILCFHSSTFILTILFVYNIPKLANEIKVQSKYKNGDIHTHLFTNIRTIGTIFLSAELRSCCLTISFNKGTHSLPLE